MRIVIDVPVDVAKEVLKEFLKWQSLPFASGNFMKSDEEVINNFFEWKALKEKKN